MQDDADSRRTGRANWPIEVSQLGSSAESVTTADERLAMMWELVTQAWAVAGKELPTYDRANTPVRVLRRGDPEDS